MLTRVFEVMVAHQGKGRRANCVRHAAFSSGKTRQPTLRGLKSAILVGIKLAFLIGPDNCHALVTTVLQSSYNI